MAAETGSWRLVAQLRDWAQATSYCEWLELGGSLGRGAGDELSDVDAGLGFNGTVPYERARDDTFVAIQRFAPPADAIVQPYTGGTDHLIVQYADGRQLSLVVFRPRARGLPPGSIALFDRSGVAREAATPEVFEADARQQREWAFLAWWALGDVAKHAARGWTWRAITALEEARSHVWQLYAASAGVGYPTFGAVSVVNAGLPAPQGIEASLPAAADPVAVLTAARALAGVLEPLAADHDVDGLARVTRDRLRRPIDGSAG